MRRQLARLKQVATRPFPLDRSLYPTVGAGVHFVIKPAQHILLNLEYAQGIGDSRGVYLKLGHAW